MKFELAHYVQRGHHFAIVDEVDSILIDEARTPLIISGPAEQSTDLYYEVDRIIPRLKMGAVVQGDTKAEEREALEATGDYIKDEKHKTVTLTESGMAKAEELLASKLQPGGLYDPANMPLLHHVNQALRAHVLFHRDVDYMISPDGEVVIVDEFTGRLMPGRRWSDGLHQAVEAKEKVKIERENQTLATVTFQNYFRKYKKLSGMTGTADTEAEEFAKIYNLDVVVIPAEPDAAPHRESRSRLPDRKGKVGRDRHRDRRGAHQGPAGAGRHGLDRKVRKALDPARSPWPEARHDHRRRRPTSTSSSTRSITPRKRSSSRRRDARAR